MYKKITSNKNHQVYLNIGVKENKLYISCHYFVNFFKTSFENEFSLEELTSNHDYFKQFQQVSQIVEEIKNNKHQIIELENSNEIKVDLGVISNTHKDIALILNKKEKTEKEILEEYKSIVNLYEVRSQIIGMKSNIFTDSRPKILLKAWINPIENLKCTLLYSFYIKYPEKLDYSMFNGYNFEVKDEKSVKEFHEKCDNIESILVICKSGFQIFGGYTPLSFSSNNKYGKDNDSFLFSINLEKKFPKNNFSKNESIWGYKNYGPCFHYDLSFTENKMNMVETEKNNYLIPHDFINKEQVIKYKSDILLDSLEIYQISLFDEDQKI
jgi:hypothetical protein